MMHLVVPACLSVLENKSLAKNIVKFLKPWSGKANSFQQLINFYFKTKQVGTHQHQVALFQFRFVLFSLSLKFYFIHYNYSISVVEMNWFYTVEIKENSNDCQMEALVLRIGLKIENR